MTPRRYLAKESMLVISGNSWESDPESGDAKGVGMFWASPNPNLPYEDEKMDVFLAEGGDLPDGGGEGEDGWVG